jgi:hypothetical protein
MMIFEQFPFQKSVFLGITLTQDAYHLSWPPGIWNGYLIEVAAVLFYVTDVMAVRWPSTILRLRWIVRAVDLFPILLMAYISSRIDTVVTSPGVTALPVSSAWGFDLCNVAALVGTGTAILSTTRPTRRRRNADPGAIVECPNGHLAYASQLFCARCGSPVNVAVAGTTFAGGASRFTGQAVDAAPFPKNDQEAERPEA